MSGLKDEGYSDSGHQTPAGGEHTVHWGAAEGLALAPEIHDTDLYAVHDEESGISQSSELCASR